MPNDSTPTDSKRPLALPHGLTFADLYSIDGAAQIDQLFANHLALADSALADRLHSARQSPGALARKAESELLIAIGPHLEDFLAKLFGVEPEVRALEALHHELAPLYVVKRQFVQRKAMNTYKPEVAHAFDGAALSGTLETAIGAPFTELAFAKAVLGWQQDEVANAGVLDIALRYAAWAAHTAEGRALSGAGVLFRAPRKLDPMQLVPL